MKEYDLARVPRFSVVIPLYQKRHRVAACLESVRAQTNPAFEVIVINDGSTDGGGVLAQQIGAGWIKYFKQDNQGVSAARNRGITLAQGDYIAFLDADDTWRPNHLTLLTDLAIKHPNASILGTGWTEHGKPFVDPVFKSKEHIIDLEFFLTRGARNYHCYATPAVAVRSDAARSQELFPVASRIAEDQDAWITLLGLGYGVRSTQVTADVFWDPVNPTMTNPRSEDFASVIFTKWNQLRTKSATFSMYVEAHRLFTIQRHVGHAPTATLLNLLLETRSFSFSIRRFAILLRMLLQMIGVLSYLRKMKHR